MPVIPQGIRDALSGGPWWVQSTTIRGLVLAGGAFVGHLTGTHIKHRTLDTVCDGLTFVGIVVAGYGRKQKETSAAKENVIAAATGQISSANMKAISGRG